MDVKAAPDKVMEVMPEKVSAKMHHRGKKDGEIFEISLPQNFFENAPKISGSKIKLSGRTLEKEGDREYKIVIDDENEPVGYLCLMEQFDTACLQDLHFKIDWVDRIDHWELNIYSPVVFKNSIWHFFEPGIELTWLGDKDKDKDALHKTFKMSNLPGSSVNEFKPQPQPLHMSFPQAIAEDGETWTKLKFKLKIPDREAEWETEDDGLSVHYIHSVKLDDAANSGVYDLIVNLHHARGQRSHTRVC